MTLYESCVFGALRAYKLTLSPLIGRHCRYLPTCSEYAAQALITHGPWRGGLLAARRLCRCHPWGPAGYDPPPPRRDEAQRVPQKWTRFCDQNAPKSSPEHDATASCPKARTWTCET